MQSQYTRIVREAERSAWAETRERDDAAKAATRRWSDLSTLLHRCEQLDEQTEALGNSPDQRGDGDEVRVYADKHG